MEKYEIFSYNIQFFIVESHKSGSHGEGHTHYSNIVKHFSIVSNLKDEIIWIILFC